MWASIGYPGWLFTTDPHLDSGSGHGELLRVNIEYQKWKMSLPKQYIWCYYSSETLNARALEYWGWVETGKQSS